MCELSRSGLGYSTSHEWGGRMGDENVAAQFAHWDVEAA